MADVIKDGVEEVVESNEDEVTETVEGEVVEEKLGEKTERLIEEMKKQLEEMKAKNYEPSQEEIAHQEKVKELWNKEVILELRLAGLEDFAEFIFVEEHNSKQLQEKIQKFQEVLGKRELSNAYVPQNHRQTDKYSLAEKNKDTKSMIGSKLSKFFK
ncbi:hypothetical protein MTP04_34430 [Lysinibacillus sp. PLM2]|nr:hypothetical protein MTP04_34430 [Lysinibacillus sp. PLM2]